MKGPDRATRLTRGIRGFTPSVLASPSMASWFSGIPRPGYASLASAAFGCAGIGVLAGIDPAYGLAAAIGIAFTAVVIGDASIGTILFTILSFLDIVNSGGPEASFMKVAGLLLFASYLASAATRNRGTICCRP